MAALDFEVNKTSGVGPTSIMVHPLQTNETESDKTAQLVVDVNGVTKSVSLLQKKKVSSSPVESWETQPIEVLPAARGVVFDGTKSGEVAEWGVAYYHQKFIDGVPQEEYQPGIWSATTTADWLEITKVDGEGKNPGKLTIKTLSKNGNYEGHYKPYRRSAKVYILFGSESITIDVIQSAGSGRYEYYIEPWIDIEYLPNTAVSQDFRIDAYEVSFINDVEVNRDIKPFKIPDIKLKRYGNLNPPNSEGTSDVNIPYECWVDNLSEDASQKFVDTLTGTVHFKAEGIGLYDTRITYPAIVKDYLDSEQSSEGLIIQPFYIP